MSDVVVAAFVVFVFLEFFFAGAFVFLFFVFSILGEEPNTPTPINPATKTVHITTEAMIRLSNSMYDENDLLSTLPERVGRFGLVITIMHRVKRMTTQLPVPRVCP